MLAQAYLSAGCYCGKLFIDGGVRFVIWLILYAYI